MGKTGRRRAMARAPRSKQLCAYCGLRIADTQHHVIALSPRELADMWAWFHYVAQGLYYFELRTILPADHTIHLVKPTTFEQFVIFRDLITRDSKRQTREHASGEIRYAFTRNDEE